MRIMMAYQQSDSTMDFFIGHSGGDLVSQFVRSPIVKTKSVNDCIRNLNAS